MSLNFIGLGPPHLGPNWSFQHARILWFHLINVATSQKVHNPHHNTCTCSLLRDSGKSYSRSVNIHSRFYSRIRKLHFMSQQKGIHSLSNSINHFVRCTPWFRNHDYGSMHPDSAQRYFRIMTSIWKMLAFDEMWWNCVKNAKPQRFSFSWCSFALRSVFTIRADASLCVIEWRCPTDDYNDNEWFASIGNVICGTVCLYVCAMCIARG